MTSTGPHTIAYLIPHDQTAAQHEREHQRRSGALERIADHVMRVNGQQHQQQQRHIRGVLYFIYSRAEMKRTRLHSQLCCYTALTQTRFQVQPIRSEPHIGDEGDRARPCQLHTHTREYTKNNTQTSTHANTRTRTQRRDAVVCSPTMMGTMRGGDRARAAQSHLRLGMAVMARPQTTSRMPITRRYHLDGILTSRMAVSGNTLAYLTYSLRCAWMGRNKCENTYCV